jgi:hypothetical protein
MIILLTPPWLLWNVAQRDNIPGAVLHPAALLALLALPPAPPPLLLLLFFAAPGSISRPVDRRLVLPASCGLVRLLLSATDGSFSMLDDLA